METEKQISPSPGHPPGQAEGGKKTSSLTLRKISPLAAAGWLSLLLALALMAIRIGKFAREPEFSPGIEIYRPPLLEVKGVTLGWKMPPGELELRASSLRPSVRLEQKKGLRTAPRSRFVLLGVQGEYRLKSGEVRKLESGLAEMEPGLVVFPKGVVVTYPDHVQRTFKELKVHLKTGVVQVRGAEAPPSSSAAP